MRTPNMYIKLRSQRVIIRNNEKPQSSLRRRSKDLRLRCSNSTSWNSNTSCSQTTKNSQSKKVLSKSKKKNKMNSNSLTLKLRAASRTFKIRKSHGIPNAWNYCIRTSWESEKQRILKKNTLTRSELQKRFSLRIGISIYNQKKKLMYSEINLSSILQTKPMVAGNIGLDTI